MNRDNEKYTSYALCREMLDTVELVGSFNPQRTEQLAGQIAQAGRLLLTGEGSSRIYPAKNAIRKSLTWGLDLQVLTEGSRQAATYDLSRFATIAASNSGRTNEVVLLMQQLEKLGNPLRFGLTANDDTVLARHATETFVLGCGWENAVAATKSVAEQALFYQSIVSHIAGRDMAADLAGVGEKVHAALALEIPADVVSAASTAGTIYFAGYNDGVAEELTLKTNEITRKPSDFLEGTYAVHGIEEVMNREDILIIVEPIEAELAKFQKVLAEGVGMKLVAISTQPTSLPTIVVPEAGELTPLVLLAAGWNLLVEIGLTLGIDLDKPERARKVGNEFTG